MSHESATTSRQNLNQKKWKKDGEKDGEDGREKEGGWRQKKKTKQNNKRQKKLTTGNSPLLPPPLSFMNIIYLFIHSFFPLH